MTDTWSIVTHGLAATHLFFDYDFGLLAFFSISTYYSYALRCSKIPLLYIRKLQLALSSSPRLLNY